MTSPVLEAQNNLDTLAAEFSNAFIESITAALKEENNLCIHCRRGGHECPICGATGYCRTHYNRHIGIFHHDSSAYPAMLSSVTKRYMKDRHMTGFFTKKTVVTLKGNHQNQFRSAWYSEAEHLALDRPSIAQFQKARNPDEETSIAQAIKDFLYETNLRPFSWTSGSGITLFTAVRNDMAYLPSDLDLPPELQVSVSGRTIEPTTDAGKVAKRWRIMTHAEGAFFTPETSRFPYVNLPGGTRLKMAVHDSDGVGDGNAMMKESAAKRLLGISGVHRRLTNIIGLQVNIMGADYFLKGIILVVPDELFPGNDPELDIIADEKSISSQVLSQHFTMGKIIPQRHKRNERYVHIEPLMQLQTVLSFVDVDELTLQQTKIAKQADKEAYQEALQKNVIVEMMEDEDWDTPGDASSEGTLGWNARERENVHRAHAKSTQFAADMNEIAIAATNRSPWASPHVHKMLAGRPAGKWRGKLQDSEPMKGPMMSGERILLMHYYYAKQPAPAAGYVRLVWKHDDPSQLIGFAYNKSDAKKYNDADDTADCDDHFSVIFMRDPETAQPYVFLIRLPMSIDGGVLLKLQQDQARKVESLGYHFYAKTGGHRWPDLHTLDEEGNPIVPYQLFAEDTADKPKWTNSEDQAVASLMSITRFQGAIGQVANLMAALDAAGLWGPHLKINLSGDVIDPAQNANKDPRQLILRYNEELEYHVRQGATMDSWLWNRVKNTIDEEPASIGLTDDRRKVGIAVEKDTGMLDNIARKRHLMSNGPPATLLQEFDPEVTVTVAEAFAQRNQLWREWWQRAQELEQEQELTDWQKDTRQALHQTRTRDAEKTIAQEGFLKAKQLPGYTPGAFHAIWVQLAIAKPGRFTRETLEPVSYYSLAGLPPEEHWAYWTMGKSDPSLIVRTFRGADRAKQAGLSMEAAYRIAKTTNMQYWLVRTQDNQPVLQLKSDAKNHVGATVEPMGFMPEISLSNEDSGDENLLVLKVRTNPGSKHN